MKTFAALDFETANQHRSSVCIMGLVFVENGVVVDKCYELIKPVPNFYSYWNTQVHGLVFNDTENAPEFSELWQDLSNRIKKMPLVDKEYLLEKFQGKGGWTFAKIPEIPPNKNTPFGWVRVRGRIDDVEINNYNLQPMGNGSLFLPIKAAIRKKINKKAGDYVHIVLFNDNFPTEIPEELRLCLMDEPNAYETFVNYTNGEQKTIIEWIYSAKTDETKVERMAKTIDKIVKSKMS